MVYEILFIIRDSLDFLINYGGNDLLSISGQVYPVDGEVFNPLCTFFVFGDQNFFI